MDVGRLAVLVRQLQSAFGGRRGRGPYLASFAGLAAGATASVQIIHDLDSTDIEVVGAVHNGTRGEAISWAVTIVSATRVDVWVRNNGGLAATFDVRLFLLPAN